METIILKSEDRDGCVATTERQGTHLETELYSALKGHSMFIVGGPIELLAEVLSEFEDDDGIEQIEKDFIEQAVAYLEKVKLFRVALKELGKIEE